MDFVASVPLTYIFFLLESASPLGGMTGLTRLIKILKFSRMLKLFKLVKLMNTMNQWNDDPGQQFIADAKSRLFLKPSASSSFKKRRG